MKLECIKPELNLNPDQEIPEDTWRTMQASGAIERYRCGFIHTFDWSVVFNRLTWLFAGFIIGNFWRSVSKFIAGWLQ